MIEKDSGGTGSSGDDKKRDNLGLEEANGDNCVVIEDPREEEEIKGEDEEGREPKVMRAPKAVPKEERDAHEATHLPFRSWCRHCVRGRARNM